MRITPQAPTIEGSATTFRGDVMSIKRPNHACRATWPAHQLEREYAEALVCQAADERRFRP